jgi:hypothetical protein
VAEGLLLRRGAIAMLVLEDVPSPVGPGTPPVPEPLGRDIGRGVPRAHGVTPPPPEPLIAVAARLVSRCASATVD